jgi:hypothetical protein
VFCEELRRVGRLLGGAKEIPTAARQADSRARLTTSGGGLAGVDMANDHDVDMELFFTVDDAVSGW